MCSAEHKRLLFTDEALPAALSCPVGCALSRWDRNAAWSQKALSQPTEALGSANLDWSKDRIWNWVWIRPKGNSLKLRQLIMTGRGTRGFWRVKAFSFSLLPVNVPSY